MARLSIVVAFAFFVCAPHAALAQHDDHAATASDQIGSASVKFETSCAPGVRDGFNTAVAMYHSFWFPEAIKAFQAVIQQDPSCAMAHWGIAMSQWGNPFGGIKNAEIVKPGARRWRRRERPARPHRANARSSTPCASCTARPTPRHTATASSATRRRWAGIADHPERRRSAHLLLRSRSRSRRCPRTRPTPSSSGGGHARTAVQADARAPRAGALHHPRLRRAAAGAARADAARRYASLAPAAPHALHMPSHTFTRLGFWSESIDTNRRSAEAARKANDAGAELHALDYQTYAYLQIGPRRRRQRRVARPGRGDFGRGARAPTRSRWRRFRRATPGARRLERGGGAHRAAGHQHALHRGDHALRARHRRRARRQSAAAAAGDQRLAASARQARDEGRILGGAGGYPAPRRRGVADLRAGRRATRALRSSRRPPTPRTSPTRQR